MTTWREQAACKGTELAVFFNGTGINYSRARQICAQCPVRGECLLDVMEWENQAPTARHGFVAGMSPDERRALQIKWDRRARRHATVVG